MLRLVLTGLLVCGGVVFAQGGNEGRERLKQAQDLCLTSAREILEAEAKVVGDDVPAPDLISAPPPEVPEQKVGTRWIRRQWAGALLIDTKGDVREVWSVQELVFDPPWPEMNAAFRESLLKRKYKAPAAPLCLGVVMVVDV